MTPEPLANGGRLSARVGPVRLSIAGRGPAFRAVAAELEARPEPPGTGPGDGVDLEVDIDAPGGLAPPTEPITYAAKQDFGFDARGYFAVSPHRYAARDLFRADGAGRLSIASVRPGAVSRLRAGLTRLRASSIMSYGLFWYIFHTVLLRKNAAFVHAAALEGDRGGILLAGTGGCGKTSTLFSLLERRDRRYLAEDFAIIDRDGVSYFNPKSVSVYASDMDASRPLRSACRTEMTWSELGRWQLARRVLRQNPMIKVSPRRIVGDGRIGHAARLESVVFLVRSAVAAPTIRDVSVHELAQRSVHAAFRELIQLSEVLRLIHANASTACAFPSESDLMGATRDVYAAAFDRARRSLVVLPPRMPPPKVAEWLHEVGVV